MRKNQLNRREFIRLTALGAASAMVMPSFAMEAAAKKSDVGSTAILWGYNVDNLETALKDMSALGFHSFETFGNTIEQWEAKYGSFKDLVAKYKVPIVSAFCGTDVLDPSKKKEEMDKLTKWCKLAKENGAKVIEYCANGSRRGYDYKEHKSYLVESMNDYAKIVSDHGLVCALHPHTGTPVETEEEVYFIMENVNTTYMKFGPDVGQLAKGGADAVKIVKDFMPLIEHVHLKDYIGGENAYVGYSPLGQGKVDLEKILTLLEGRRKKMAGMIMFELDPGRKSNATMTDYEAAKVSHDYLEKLGYTFKA